MRLEQLGEPRARAPQGRRLDSGGRREVLADRLEELADEAFGRPVGEPDLAAGLGDANELAGGALLIGGEHYSEGGDHDVEALVSEWQGLRVGLAECNVEPVCPGALAGALQQCRHVVGRGDVAPAPRGGEGGVAVAGCDIEHALAGTKVERFAKLLADDLQRGADDGVVARRPCGLLPGLERRNVDLWGLRFGGERECGHGHDPAPWDTPDYAVGRAGRP